VIARCFQTSTPIWAGILQSTNATWAQPIGAWNCLISSTSAAASQRFPPTKTPAFIEPGPATKSGEVVRL